MANKYESIFIVDSSLEEEGIKALVEKFKTLLEKSAELEKLDEWGKRKLAYPVNDMMEGYYVFADFSADPEFPKELERIYKITDGIIKYMIIRKDN